MPWLEVEKSSVKFLKSAMLENWSNMILNGNIKANRRTNITILFY